MANKEDKEKKVEDPYAFDDGKTRQAAADHANDGDGDGDDAFDDHEDDIDVLEPFMVDRIEDLGLDSKDFEGMKADAVENILDGFEAGLEKESSAPPVKRGGNDKTDFKLGDDVDEEVVAAFKGLSKEIATLGADLKGIKESSVDAQLINRVDTYIAGEESRHGDGATKLFKSPVKRKAIANTINVLRKGYESSGQRVPDERKLFRQAVHSTLGDDYAKMRGKKLDADVETRQNSFTKRPDSRTGEPKNVEGKAIANLTARMKKTDYFGDDGVTEEF